MDEITQTQAYAILKLPIGAHKDAVENSYKRLASQWFPEKHHNSPDAIKAFSEVNRSFYMLNSNKNASNMSYTEMLRQYHKFTNSKSKIKGEPELNNKSNKNKKSKGFTEKAEIIKSNDTNGLGNAQKLNQVHEKNVIENHVINNNQLHNESENSEELMVASRSFAIEGNLLANQGLYGQAVEAFTKAINLNPNDFRFFGNRSFCFEREGLFDDALKDANMAITLAPDWPKGYFRKAKALSGLMLYAEAEQCYLHVMSLDSTCLDAKVELWLVRSHQITEMGFGKQAAQRAIQEFDSVQDALDALLSNQIPDSSIQDSHQNDENGNKEQFQKTKSKNSTISSQSFNNSSSAKQASNTKRQQKQQTPLQPIPQHHYEQAQKQIQLNKQQATTKMNSSHHRSPRNPDGLTSLWVGNVLPEVKQEQLQKMFSKYGQVQSVKSIPEKFCAFINFTNKECAGKAMQALQSADVLGQKLLIKFPDHPVNGEKSATKTSQSLGQTQAGSMPKSFISQKNATSINGSRTTGPVNGDECYFWRTTGCQFTGDCRYKHIPDHKGVDKKPWHKSK